MIKYKLLLVILFSTSFLFSFAQEEFKFPYPEPYAEPDVSGNPTKPLSEKKFGYYNLTKKDGEFKLIIGFSYDEARQFSKITGYATARIDNGWGIINVDGSPLVPFIYDKIEGPNELGYYIICLENKWGILDKSGQITVGCQYDNMSDLYDGWYEVSKDDNWGYVHWSGAYASSYSEYEKKKQRLDK